MSEFLLRFSSKNREKVGVSLSHDFTTKFNIPIQLSYNMKHEVAVRLIKMTTAGITYHNHLETIK